MATPTITYDDSKHEYRIDGQIVPSVTQILDAVTPKPALTWWGMRVGLAAVIKLLQSDALSALSLLAFDYEDHLTGKPRNKPEQAVWRGRGKHRKQKTPLEAAAIEARLTTNHIRDTKADLGTAVHNAIEQIGIADALPTIGDLPLEVQPYIRALAKWWLEQDPEFIHQEIIVASTEHQFAGRFDLIARLGTKLALIDFKTSGGLYESYSEQLALYQLAYEEMSAWPGVDHPTLDRFELVHLRPDGGYEMRPAYTSRETAIHAVSLFHSRARDEANKPSPWKE